MSSPKVGALGDIDIETCQECGGAMKVAALAHPCARGIRASMHIIACIEDPVVMPKALAALAGQALQKILNHHLKEKGEYRDAFRLPESRGPPQTRLFG